jgi:hypothetical protein
MRAIITFLGLVALSSVLTACPNNDSDTGTDTDTGSDTSDPDAVGTLTVNYTFDGNPVACFTNLNGVKYGTTNSPISGVAVGTYPLTLGDGDHDGWTADDPPLPLHNLGSPDDNIVAPRSDITVVEGPDNVFSRTANRHISGRWTCALDAASLINSSTVAYRDGAYATLQILGEIKVDGESVSCEGCTESLEGGFVSPTHLLVTVHSTQDFEVECWAGEIADRP